MSLLGGIRIISFNHFLMGPLGIQLLADLGAEVIAIESLDGAFQRKWSPNDVFVGENSPLFACANRNKRSLALNLRSEEGVRIAKKLISNADVLAENFRPGVMDRLGLGYEQVKAFNPKIIYASASGYGSDGPYRDTPGQDLLVQALAGLAAVTGEEPDGARAVGVSAVDHHGAALLAVGILAALLGRQRGAGNGCRVDVSLLAAALDLQTESLISYLNGRRPTSIRQPRNISGWAMRGPYGIYSARDGKIAISLCTNRQLGEALGAPDLASIPDEDSFVRRDEISRLTEAVTRTFSIEELEARFSANHVWHMKVNDYEAVEQDPQVRHNAHFITVASADEGTPLTLLSHPIRYDGRAPEVRLAPQPLGAQSRQILSELGYSREEIEQCVTDHVVGTTDAKAQSVDSN